MSAAANLPKLKAKDKIWPQTRQPAAKPVPQQKGILGQKTALLVGDMIHDFLHPKGALY